MRHTILLLLTVFFVSMTPASTKQDSMKFFLNGTEVKDKISLKASGKLELVLPQGWRFITGKVKILQGDEVKKAQQLTGETGLKSFDFLQFIKLNAVSGNHVSLEFSVRTTESGTLATMKIPVE